MGVGLPYAMGVKFAKPDAQVAVLPGKLLFKCVFRNFQLVTNIGYLLRL